jgi:hypothetical protein
MTKHSPSPWTFSARAQCTLDSLGAVIAMQCGDGTDAQADANVRLLKAAPALLAALLTARDQLEEELRTAPGNDEADAVDAVLVEIRRVLNKLEPQS